ncbi:velvet factor [Kickxella alabastrina]|uniref:velvet factor n=1 Tax=Kickxella alabastrina TaxID=61397 RepID=UPI00221F9711|nr:velvet factor [Kickxella alabastrina]KAI7832946.1 velvet factor [Kickxella alabastrina]
MCGSSDKDWRPVSPPPVLKLELYDVEGNPVIEGGFMQFLVIHTTLWKEDQEEELTVVELPHNASSKRISAAAKSRKRGVTQFGCRAAEPGLEMENNLLGDYTASSSIVDDEMGERGCFFVFPNLSIRLEGRYRLRFTLIKLPSMGDAQHPMIPTCLSSVFSDPFDVYSIKTFPGMIESTALSRSLAQQGIKIPIRNTQDNT